LLLSRAGVGRGRGVPRPDVVTRNRWLAALGLLVAGVFVWSAIGPHDRLTWWLEVLPAVAAAIIIALTWRRFPLSTVALTAIALHAIILIVGGHYTYALVPLGDWARDAFDLTRNNYDRLGHVAQGFFPAIVVREILIRRSPVTTGRWLFFLTTSTCLAISAFYELLEWWTALLAEDDSVSFLATQGDPWDTQWDMFLALLGAMAAQLAFGRVHDRSLSRISG
jgi:putative membrane protein